MVAEGSAEEQRFDFSELESPAEPAEDVAAALKRRIDEVLAVAKRAGAIRPGAEHVRNAPGTQPPPTRPVTYLDPASGRARRPEAPERLVEVAPDDDADAKSAERADEALTIAEFYERVKRALSLEFSDEVWVTGEIRGLRESRGHRFIELADEGGDRAERGTAQALEVVCWAGQWPRIAAQLDEVGVKLEVGRVVRVRGRVTVWEGGSKLRFTLTSLDVEALLGGIAAARRRLLHALEVEDLLEANRRRPLSTVPLRIGLVTSPGSEAERDFRGQLARSGFAFEVHLERSLVQGPEAPTQIADALERIARFEPELVVLVRGGGARGDLAAFDSELVARAIATAPFPVWTGIGHTGDRSVADEVAQRALVTPTHCGEAVVARVEEYWFGVVKLAEQLTAVARGRLTRASAELSTAAHRAVVGARHQVGRRTDELRNARVHLDRCAGATLGREEVALAASRERLASSARRLTDTQSVAVTSQRQLLSAYDPRRQLERGWTLTRDSGGQIVRSVATLEAGAELVTRFVDGEAVSVLASLVGTDESEPPDGGEGGGR